MANGASKIFKIMQNAGTNTVSKLVSLTVKTLSPLTFTLDDKITLNENFYILSDSIDTSRLSIGDTLLATTFNDNQKYYIQQAVNSQKQLKSQVIDNLTSTSITENQGKVLNDKIQEIIIAGGTSNYNELNNKPQINSVELKGNVTLDNLGIIALLNNKVDKEEGKGLSTNDFTTSFQTKLAGIENYAEVNKIENIQVNGTTQTITNKTININVPTNNNQLTNGAGYQTYAQVTETINVALANLILPMLNVFYPVGSYYETSDEEFNPNTTWGRYLGTRYTRLCNCRFSTNTAAGSYR